MITITNTTQRIFFEPSQSIPVNVELCGVWLLKYGVWSNCGVWDNDAFFTVAGDYALPRYELVTGAGTIKKTAPLVAQKNSRLYSANADDISQNVGDDDYVLNIYYSDEGEVVDQYIDRVQTDNGVLFASRGLIASRITTLTGCTPVEQLIYSTRLKIKKSQVARKAKAQPVTRKVNRITI